MTTNNSNQKTTSCPLACNKSPDFDVFVSHAWLWLDGLLYCLLSETLRCSPPAVRWTKRYIAIEAAQWVSVRVSTCFCVGVRCCCCCCVGWPSSWCLARQRLAAVAVRWHLEQVRAASRVWQKQIHLRRCLDKRALRPWRKIHTPKKEKNRAVEKFEVKDKKTKHKEHLELHRSKGNTACILNSGSICASVKKKNKKSFFFSWTPRLVFLSPLHIRPANTVPDSEMIRSRQRSGFYHELVFPIHLSKSAKSPSGVRINSQRAAAKRGAAEQEAPLQTHLQHPQPDWICCTGHGRNNKIKMKSKSDYEYPGSLYEQIRCWFTAAAACLALRQC